MARGISPETNKGASLGSSAKNWANLFTQNITLSNNFDLTGSAIVAKSLTSDGYIKYASGLIIQWGFAQSALGGKTVDVTFPVTFINSYRIVGNRISNNINDNPYIVNVYNQSKSNATFYTNTEVPSVSNWSLQWVAIGY